MKATFIINPRSAGGKTGRQLEHLKGILLRSFPEARFEVTRAPNHGIELARQAAHDGADIVVSVGGDGTSNEVINGLMLAKEKDGIQHPPFLGLIPQGTGGDLRRTFEVPHKLSEYIERLHYANPRPLDIGKATFLDHDGQPAERYFVNILSVGLGGLVDRYVAEYNKNKSQGWFGGRVKYYIASVKALKHSSLGKLRCTALLREGDESKEVVLNMTSRNMAICNGRYFGSGMKIAPMAQPDDGLFEVINLDAPHRFDLLHLSQAIYSGKHLKSRMVRHFQVEGISIELVNDEIQKDFCLDVDGEPLGTLPLRIEMKHQALQLKI